MSTSTTELKNDQILYEEYLESIVDTIRESLLILDKNHRIITANKTFYEQFKVSENETIDRIIYDLGNGQWNIPALKKLLEEILPTHNPFNDFRVKHKFPNIGEKVMLLNARQIKAKGKWKDRILIAIEDITRLDQDRLEKEAGIERERDITSALKRSQEESDLQQRMYEAVTSSTLDLIYVFDLNYRFTYANKALLEMWGTQDYVGKSLLELGYEPWHAEMHEREIDQVVATKKPIRGEVPFNHATLGRRTYDYIFVPVFNAKKEVVAVAGTTRDITELRKLTQQKDEFLGIASHELKTPVTSIKAYGQVLQTIFQRKGDTTAVEQLQKMDAQINKLTSLIGDLLDVTKIQTGKIEFNEEEFDINELLNEITDEMQLTTEKHNLVTETKGRISVFGDRERIGQVISNLISNAIKYSPDSEEIIIMTEKDTKKVVLSVQDYGVGIPKDNQEKVFEQFFRVSGPRYITIPGLGLGLYISNEIIKRQGGKMWVKSLEGKGSTFYFSLPLFKKKK